MNSDLDALFPADISDETAAVLADLLHALALAWENRYLTHIRRYRSGQLNLYDPEQPWRSPPRRR